MSETKGTVVSDGNGRKVTHLNAVLYARVSSKEQEKEGFSIPAQLKLLNQYAAEKGFRVLKEFVDVETAKTSGRTQFREMVNFLQSSKDVKVILVEKTDRLYRNFRDYVGLEDLDLEIHLVKEGEILSKDSKSHVKFIHGIKVLMAKNYIDNLSEEVRKGLREKAEQGGYPGGRVPVGYFINKDSHIVEIDPEKAGFVRKLFESYASGNYSLTALRQVCLKEGFSTRMSEKRISRSNLERVLKNVFYTGKFLWNGKLYKGSHPPIVNEELFAAVQDAFRGHNKPKGRMGKNFAFAGLLTCGMCGCAITAEIKKGKYIYYHCTGFKGRCKEPYLREEVLAERLGEVVKAIHIGDDKLEWLREALKLSHEDERAYHDGMVKSLHSQYNKLQSRIDQAYLDKLDGHISAEFWRAKTADWRNQQEQLRAKIEAHEKANTNYIQEGIQILELANQAYYQYVRQTPHEKARLLKILLSNCSLKGGTPYPTYRKPFDLLANGVKTQNWLGDRDSNPDSVVQSHMSCRWTISQWASQVKI